VHSCKFILSLYGSDYPVVWRSDMKSEVDFIKSCKHLIFEEKENSGFKCSRNSSYIMRVRDD
jgi:hypothetical protein